jgi:hypothetical protein
MVLVTNLLAGIDACSCRMGRPDDPTTVVDT